MRENVFFGEGVLVPGRKNRICKGSKSTQVCSEVTESQLVEHRWQRGEG